MATSEKRDEFFNDIFVAALEGGIQYWATRTTYEPFANDVWDATIESAEEDWGVATAYQPDHEKADDKGWIDIEENTPLVVDAKVVEHGWNDFMDRVIHAAKTEDRNASCSRDYFKQAVIQYLTYGEDGDHDADVADIVVQLGLFGEIVYS